MKLFHLTHAHRTHSHICADNTCRFCNSFFIPPTRCVCMLCGALNDVTKVMERTAKEDKKKKYMSDVQKCLIQIEGEKGKCLAIKIAFNVWPNEIRFNE